MLVGIYSNHFLGVYHQRSKNLECFNCGLISPKNYIIECKHCICQNCLSDKHSSHGILNYSNAKENSEFKKL